MVFNLPQLLFHRADTLDPGKLDFKPANQSTWGYDIMSRNSSCRLLLVFKRVHSDGIGSQLEMLLTVGIRLRIGRICVYFAYL